MFTGVLCLKRSTVCRVYSLDGLPEELLLELFETVLRKGKLQPRVLSLFEVRPGHCNGNHWL